MLTEEALQSLFQKWIDILRLKNQWDIRLELVRDPAFHKTGDIKIDCDDRKAILMLNALNPKQENPEEVIVHELMHLKLYPLDQLTEGLIESHYEADSPAHDAVLHAVYDHAGANGGRTDKVLPWCVRRKQSAFLRQMQHDEEL